MSSHPNPRVVRSRLSRPARVAASRHVARGRARLVTCGEGPLDRAISADCGRHHSHRAPAQNVTTFADRFNEVVARKTSEAKAATLRPFRTELDVASTGLTTLGSAW